ncbi:hypothetical protein Tco_1093838 [Tanacetum coccineum]|uniref:Uncharacterized protein n=1 Tax=Tanacetum coccineum TaxID=301880 RepID=A0ABQ5IEC8_9ASTR
MRIDPEKTRKEPTYQVVLDALALTTCYPTFLITADVPVIYMQQFWVTINKHGSSYQFKVDKKRFYVDMEVFREILQICPRLPDQEFDEPLMISNNVYFIASFIPLITEYLVNISKRRAFWSLNEDILKITILKTNTPYPSRKIRRIRACTHQRPQRKEDQYSVSRRCQYAVSNPLDTP